MSMPFAGCNGLEITPDLSDNRACQARELTLNEYKNYSNIVKSFVVLSWLHQLRGHNLHILTILPLLHIHFHLARPLPPGVGLSRTMMPITTCLA